MLLLLIFLQGCKALELSAPYETAEDAVRSPASWVNAGQGNEGRISTGWIHTFRDDRLEDIVDEVLMNNPSLQAAAARLAALCRDAGEGRTLRRVETATARVDRLSRAPVA